MNPNQQLIIKQMKTTNKRYEAPKAEVIAIETLSVLCASPGGGGGDTSTNPTGNGLHFDTEYGTW